MQIDFVKLRLELIGSKIPRPLSGTLSGHAAGEPFDKFVYGILKAEYPENVYRQYEYLNELFSNHPHLTSYESRANLIPSKALRTVILRGKKATQDWNLNNLFEEKQDDTADIIIKNENEFILLDIKTRNLSKSAQAPNIISSKKLAFLVRDLLVEKMTDSIQIKYIELDWILEGDSLVCKEVFIADLFKEKPENLYINWAAAMQLQFHVSNLEQDFSGTNKEWCLEYLKKFALSAKKRSNDMIEQYVKPFELFFE